jgi:DNA polymerase V
MLALVDCNACFASCEQIFRPDLRGKPVVVLSNNDGCIVAKNREARALDIPDLAPYFQVKELLARHNVHVFSSNYELYGDISRRVMTLLEGFGSAIEIYSIDEAFLNLDGFPNLPGHGKAIKQACWREQRMPVCVGIAPTKTLAKLANHIAKKSGKLEGVCVMERPDEWRKVFRKLPVNKVWGVGSRIATRLALWGIHNVEELRQANTKSLRRGFGVVLERTVRELNGEPCLALENQPTPKQQIFCSRSFSHKVTSQHDLNESIATHAMRAAEKLRRQNSVAGCVYLLIQTSRFQENYYGNSASLPLPFPTNDSRNIVKAALELSARIYRPGHAYARSGVGLLDLAGAGFHQQDLFTSGQAPRSQVMMEAIDRINRRYGQETLFLARQGVQRSWRMSRSMKSPAYTTRLQDLPVVRIGNPDMKHR